MSRTLPELSTFDRAISAVFGASFGLIALISENALLRALTAVAGSGLLLRAAVSRTTADPSSALHKRLDDALADTFPASDPPTSHLADEPPSNAEAKWEAYRKAHGGPDDAETK